METIIKASDDPISTRRLHLVLINKKKRTCHLIDFVIPVDHRMKKFLKIKDKQILGSCQRVEKTVGYKADSDIICTWIPWNSLQRPGKETARTGVQRKN